MNYNECLKFCHDPILCPFSTIFDMVVLILCNTNAKYSVGKAGCSSVPDYLASIELFSIPEVLFLGQVCRGWWHSYSVCFTTKQ